MEISNLHEKEINTKAISCDVLKVERDGYYYFLLYRQDHRGYRWGRLDFELLDRAEKSLIRMMTFHMIFY